MFGYVIPPAREMSAEDTERFREAYCGLCHTLGRRYGFVGRWILNYDFAFLTVLLAGLSAQSSGQTSYTPGQSPQSSGQTAYTPQTAYTIGKRRCIAHPVRPRTYLQSDVVMNLAADESVILTWWKLRDGIQDHRFPGRVPYQAASGLLRGAYQKAAQRRPDFDETVRRQLTLLREIERADTVSLDIPADAFAVLLRGAVSDFHSGAVSDSPVPLPHGVPDMDSHSPGVSPSTGQRVLEHMLYHLGRWIYLIDAADDLREDVRHGNYNPVALRYGLRDGLWTRQAREEFVLTLDASVRQMAAAFELWDFGVWTGLIREMVYRGFFRTGRAVLDGTFHTRPGWCGMCPGYHRNALSPQSPHAESSPHIAVESSPRITAESDPNIAAKSDPAIKSDPTDRIPSDSPSGLERGDTVDE